MDKFRTVVSMLLMFVAAIIGFFLGSSLNSGFDCAILFALVTGIGCIIYVLDNPRK